MYKLLNSGDLGTFLSGLADGGGATFIVGLVVEGEVWIMVMALGKLSEAQKTRTRGRTCRGTRGGAPTNLIQVLGL